MWLKRFSKYTQLEKGLNVLFKKENAIKSIGLPALIDFFFLNIIIFILMQISMFPKMNTPTTFIYLCIECVITTEFQQIINGQIKSL